MSRLLNNFNGSRKLNIIILSIIIAGYLAGVFYSYGFTVDDSYISLRYAKNLVDHGRLSFNPGEAPNEGYSNFLLVLIEALAIGVGVDNPIIVPKLIGIISGILTIVLLYMITRHLIESEASWIKFLPSIAIASSTPFLVWSVGGLETTLFTLFIVTGVYFLIHSMESNIARHVVLSDLAFCLAALTRPEGVMFWALSYVYLALNYKHLSLSKRIHSAAFFITIFSSYLVWKYFYFGSIFPLTFYTKAARPLTIDSMIDGATRFTYLLKINLNYFYLLFFLIAIILILKRMSRHVTYVAYISVIYALYVFSLGYNVAMDDVFRLYVPFLPLFYVAAAVGAEFVCQKIRGKSAKIFIASFMLFVMTQISIGINDMNVCWNVDHNFGSRPDFAGDLRSYQQGWDDYKFFGEWLGKNIPANSTLVIPDIGAVSYFSNLKIIDSWSLVTKEIAIMRSQQLKYPPDSPQVRELNKKIVGFIMDKNPELIVMQFYELDRYKLDSRIFNYKIAEIPLPSGRNIILAIRPDMLKYFNR